MARNVGSLFVSLGLHSEDYHTKLTKAQRAARSESRKIQAEFNNLSKDAAIAFAATAAAITLAIKKTADYSDTIDEMAYRTGESRTRLQELDYIAKITGTSLEGMQRAVKTLSGNMLDASRGTGNALKVFKDLHISFKNTDGTLRNVDDVMTDTAGALSKMTDKTKMLAYTNDLYGKGGQELLPMLLSNKTGMAALTKNAHDYGNIMTDEVIIANAKFKDDLDTAKFAGEGLVTMFGSKLIPVLDKYLMQGLEWYKNNKAIIEQKMGDYINDISKSIGNIASNKEGIKAIFDAAVLSSKGILAAADGWVRIAGAIASILKYPGVINPYGTVGTETFLKGKMAKENLFKGPYSAPVMKPMVSPEMLKAMESYGGTTQAGAMTGGGKPTMPYGFGGYPWLGGADSTKAALDMFKKSGDQRLAIYNDLTEKEKLAAWDKDKAIYDMEFEMGENSVKFEQDRLQKRMDMWASFGDNMASVLAQSSMEAGNVFENIQKGFTRMLEIMVAQMAAKAAVFSILNLFTGGIFGGAVGGLAKYVFGFRQSGGPVSAGKSYVVGEHGPELFTPRESGRVISNKNINDYSRLTIHFSGAEKSAMQNESDLQLANRIKRVIRDYHLVGAY